MRLSRVVLPHDRSGSAMPQEGFLPPGRSAGERLKLGRSGETQASTFGPPLPIIRPG